MLPFSDAFFPIHHHWCLLLLLFVCTFLGKLLCILEALCWKWSYRSHMALKPQWWMLNAPIKRTPNFGVQDLLVRHSTDFCCLLAADVGKGQGGPGALVNLQQPCGCPDLHLQVVSCSCQVSSHHNPACPHLRTPVRRCSQGRGEKRGAGEGTPQASFRP